MKPRCADMPVAVGPHRPARRLIRAGLASLTAALVAVTAPAGPAAAAPAGAWGTGAAARSADAGLPVPLWFPPLAASATTTASGYAPLGDVSRTAAFTDQRTEASAVDRPGSRAALVGALGLGAVGDTPLRAGGSGTLTVSLTDQTGRATTVRRARVAIRIPAVYRLGGVAAPGWRCGPVRGRTLRCAARGPVRAGGHAAVRVGLRARRPGRARVAIRASWREPLRSGARRTTARRGARAQRRAAALARPRTATATEVFTVRPRLGVRVTTAHRRVLGDGAGVDGTPLVLTASLRRYDAGLPVDYRWRQLGGGPRVRWLAPAEGRAAGRLVTAKVSTPAVARRTRLRFALTARDWRGAARGVATVVVLPHRKATLAPGPRRLRVAARGSTSTRRYLSRDRVTRGIEVTGSALAGPRAGQRAGLRVLDQGGELERVRWSVVRGPRTTLAGRRTDRERLSFVVPHGARQLTIGVRAVVSGRVVRAREVVHVVGPIRPARPGRRAPASKKARRRGARRRAVRATTAQDDARADAAGPFCTYWNAAAAGDAGAGTASAPIRLSDGTTVTLGSAVASGADCAADDARVAFTTGEVRVGRLVFEDVAGSLDAAGVTLRSGWLDLPDGWWSDLPPRLRVEPGAAGGWAADLGEDGRWGPLKAQIALDDGVELLPLPEGWTFPAGQSTLSYAPATRTFGLRSVAQAPPGQDGKVTLTGSLALDGATSVTVDAERVVVLHGVDDRAVALSGTGTLTTTPGAGDDGADDDSGDEGPRAVAAHTPMGGDGTLTGSITLRTDPADAELALTSNVAVRNASATWDSDGIAVATDVLVTSARGTFAATARGEFHSTSQWRLAIAQAAPFDLGDGVTLEDVEGIVERSPLAPTEEGENLAAEVDDEGTAGKDVRSAEARTAQADADPGDGDARRGDRATTDTFGVSLSGAVRGWSPSPSLTGVSVRGALTNMCTDEEPGCSTRQVRLALEVRGDAHVYDQTIPWYGIAAVNLSTFQLRFEGGARLAGFGPDDLHLDDVQLRLSTGGPQWCRPAADGAARTSATGQAAAEAPDPTRAERPATLAADQELAFSISGRGRVLGESFQAAGEFARSGFCLTGAFGEFTPEGLPAGGAGRPLVDDVRLAYASKDAELVVAGRTLKLRAGDVRLSGALNLPPQRLPAQLRDTLGARADLALALTRTRGAYGLSGSARFTLAQPAYVLGSAARPDETRLGVTAVDLAFDYSASTSLRLEMAAKAALQTPANAARGVAASRTPLFLAAGIDLGTPSVNLSAGVDVSDPAVDGGTVRDAFGQPGLDVRRLVVSASLGADTSLGIAADATLPDGWTRSLGMPDRTPAKVAFSVSQTNACLELEVGQLPAVLGGAPTSTQPVLTLGPLAATWAQIVIAPTGCTIGNPSPGKPGYKIDPGFALGFDGQVGPTPVTFAAAMRKHDGSAFEVRGTVRVGAFDAGPVSFRRTALELDIDTGGPNRHVDVAFSGGMDAGESTIDVAGRFTANDRLISAALVGRGRLRFADTTFAEGDVDARLEFAKADGAWTAKQANVNARTQIMGAEAGLLLAYRDGSVATAAGAFQYRATVGPLGVRAGALFAYAPDGVRLDGDARDCSIARLQEQRGAKELILRLCSSLQLGPLSRDMTMTTSLPQQWDFDFVVPRSEVGLYLASVYLRGELHASLRIGLSGLNFWVRSGEAAAGGCLHMFWWDKCADGINVAFKPSTGRFEGTFLGIAVSWGSDSWRASPAPQGPVAPERQTIGADDRVAIGRADRIAFETSAGAGQANRVTTYQPAAGGAVPPGMILDAARREVMLTLPLTPAARRDAPKPARAYLLVFRGVAFDRDEPATTPVGGTPMAAYRGVTVARAPDSGETAMRSFDLGGDFELSQSGRRLVWRARGEALIAQLVAEGLPLAVTLDFPTAERRASSRAALQRELS